MAINVFEIITVGGSVGVEENFTFNDDQFLLNIYEPIFTTVSLTNVNLKPVGWSAEGFSDLDGMGGGITLTQLLNPDFGQADGSSWIFNEVTELSISNATLHSSFASISGWNIKMFSIDNDGMDNGNNTNIEDDATPNNDYAKGNERKLIPDLNLIGATSDNTTGSDPVQNATDRVGNKLDFQFMPNINASTDGGDTQDVFGETAYSVSDALLDFGSAQGLSSFSSTYSSVAPIGTFGVQGRPVRITSSGMNSVYIFWFQYYFNVASEVTGTFISDLYSNAQGVFTTNRANGTVNDVRKVSFPLLRLRNIFFNHSIGRFVTLKLKVNFSGDAGIAPQELNDTFTDGVAADVQSTALTNWSVSPSQGTITTSGSTDGRFTPDFAHFTGEQYLNMSTYVYVFGNRLYVKNKNGAAQGTSISSRLSLSVGESYRVYFKVGISENPNYTVSIKYADGKSTVLYQPLSGIGGIGNSNIASSTNNTGDAFLDFNLYPVCFTQFYTPIGESWSQSTADVILTIQNEASVENRTVGFDWIRFERVSIGPNSMGLQTSKTLDRESLNSLGNVFVGGGQNKPPTGTVNSSMWGNYIPDSTTNAGRFCVTTSDLTTRPNGESSNAEATYISHSLDSTNNVNIKQHSSVDDTELAEGFHIASKVYANPFKHDDLLRNDETVFFQTEEVANKDSYGFFVDGYVTLTCRMKIGSRHLNMFFDEYTTSEVVMSEVLLEEVSFETNKGAHITVSSDNYSNQNQGTNLKNQARYLYDFTSNSVDNETTQFGVQPPEMEISGVFLPTQVSGEEQVEISWDVHSMNGTTAATPDDLILDYGDGTPIIAQINTSNLTGSVQQVPQGQNLRFRHITKEEKGSDIAGLEAIINSVSIAQVASDEIFIQGSKHGDETSDNSGTNPLMPPNTAGFRVQSFDNLGNAANIDLDSSLSQSPYIWKNIEGAILDAVSINIDIVFRQIPSDNEIIILENIQGGYLGGAPVFTNQSFGNSVTNTTQTIVRNRSLCPEDSINLPIVFRVVFTTTDNVPLDTIIQEIIISYVAISGDTITEERLDLNEDFEFSLNYKNKNFEELSQGSGSYSKTFKIPATAKNRRIFDFQNEIESSLGNFSKLKKNVPKAIDAKVNAEGLTVFTGQLELLGSERDEAGATFLKTVMKGGNSSWISSLKSKNLIDLHSPLYKIRASAPYTAESADVTQSLQENAGFDNAENKIVFPLVDNGKWFVSNEYFPDTNSIGFENIKAGYRISLVLREIFKDEGYTLVSRFLNESTDWSAEFESSYTSEFNNLVGIAPKMVVREEDIANNSIKGRMTTENPVKSCFSTLETANPAPLVSDELGLNIRRPYLSSFVRKSSPDEVGLHYAFDFCFVSLNQEVVTTGIEHELSNVGSFSTSGSTDFTGSFMSGGSSGITATSVVSDYHLTAGENLKSKIRVSQSGYYDISVYINGDFNVLDATLGDNNTEIPNLRFLSPAGVETENLMVDSFFMERYVSAALVTGDFSSAGSASSSTEFYSHDRLAGLMFDLQDSSFVELDGRNYDTTRISLKNTQYLNSETDYWIIILDVVVTDRGYSSSSVIESFGTTFQLNEVVVDLKLCDEVYPMDGLLSLIYNYYSGGHCPQISWRNILPDVSQLDFVSEVSKMFNLTWQVDNLTKTIIVEPFYDFYNRNEEPNGSGVKYLDWTEKALIVEIEDDFSLTGNLMYRMNRDSSDWSLSNYSSPSLSSGLSYGDKRINIDKNKDGEDKELELSIFSAMIMDIDTFLLSNNTTLGESYNAVKKLYLPRIWGVPDSPLEPELNEQKPEPNNSHSHKIGFIMEGLYGLVGAYNSNAQFSIPYSISRSFIYNDDGPTNAYVYGKKGFSTSSVINVSTFVTSDAPNEDFPNPTFMDTVGQFGSSTISKGGLFNKFHQPYINQLIFRDKKIFAEVNLTASDINNFDFRNLVKIEENLYYVSRIVDFNFSGEVTTVELILATISTDSTEVIQ